MGVLVFSKETVLVFPKYTGSAGPYSIWGGGFAQIALAAAQTTVLMRWCHMEIIGLYTKYNNLYTKSNHTGK